MVHAAIQRASHYSRNAARVETGLVSHAELPAPSPIVRQEGVSADAYFEERQALRLVDGSRRVWTPVIARIRSQARGSRPRKFG